jgi:DNA replication factor Cdt1 C-terminal domain
LISSPSNKEIVTSQSTDKESFPIKKRVSLLDRIKAKEAQAAIDVLTGKAERAMNLALIESLYDYVDTISLTFNSAKKTALTYSYIEEKLMDSCKSSTSPHSVRERFEMLLKICPGWLTPTDEHYRVDKSKSTKELRTLINDYKEAL